MIFHDAILQRGTGDRAPLLCQPSRVFPGRVLCGACGLPVPPDSIVPDREMCVMCAERIDTTHEMVQAIANDKTPPRGTVSNFSAMLRELKEQSTPASVGMAERILESLGGPDKLADMMLSDLGKIRGDDLDPAMRALHQTDWKVLKGMYDLLTKIIKERDDLVLQHKDEDPLHELADDELMRVAAESARMFVVRDAGFRREILALIEETEPDLINEVIADRYRHALPIDAS